MRKENGAITLEAAISLVVTMAVVLTLSLFARVVYAQGVVQHALSQTANELATFSYFYSITGLPEVSKALHTKSGEASESVSGVIDEFNGTMSAFKSGDINGTLDGFDKAGDAVKSAGGIKGIMENLMKAIAGEMGSEAKTQLLIVPTEALMKTYMPSDRQKFNKMCMFVNEDGTYIKDDSFPVHLEYSRFFDNSSGDEIHLVAVYKIKPATPIPILDKPITIVQNAKTRAWMSKWKNPDSKSSSVWDLPYAERAEKIAATNGALNLSKNFETIRGFDLSTGKASMFITIDVREESYTGSYDKVKNKIKSKKNDLMNYKGCTYGGTTVGETDIKTVDYYVYIPSDASDADKANVKKAAEELAEDDFEMYSGGKIKLNIIVKEIN